MKLLGSTKSKITKGKNGKKLSHLEITEVVLVHCGIAINDYQQDSRVVFAIIPNKFFGQFYPKNLYFKNHFSY